MTHATQPIRIVNLADQEIRLSLVQCETIVKLGTVGGSAVFDLHALNEICRLRLAEVNLKTRRLGLTTEGTLIYQQLADGDGHPGPRR
jgi:hypothetical protein